MSASLQKADIRLCDRGAAIYGKKPFLERKAALRKVLKRTRRGIQYVEHTEGDGGEMFKTVCKLGLDGIVSKRLELAVLVGAIKSDVLKKLARSAGIGMVR